MNAVIGSWDRTAEVRGLYLFRFEDGALTPAGTLHKEISVSSVLHIPEEKLLYVSSDAMRRGPDGTQGNVLVFRTAEDSILQELQNRTSDLPKPTDLCLDASGRYLLVTHYGGRDKRTDPNTGAVLPDDTGIAVYRRNADGTIGEQVDLLYTDGGPEKHSNLRAIRRCPGTDTYLVCDKGADCLYSVSLDAESGKLTLLNTLPTGAGSMPRLTVFLPGGTRFIACFEGSTVLQVCSIDTVTGAVTAEQQLDLSPDEKGRFLHSSDLLSVNGGTRFYASLRTKNTIHLLDLNPDGTLSERASWLCGGNNPRGLTLTPDGKCLLSANADDSTVTAFSVADDGTLTLLGTIAQVPNAANIVLF